MLPRAQRLRRRKDISAVVRHGRTTSTRPFLIHALRTSHQTPHFAVVVSRQTERRAVRRNRVKRQIRAVLHQLRTTTIPGVAVLIRVRSAALRMTTTELKAELHQAFLRSHLLV